MMLAILAVTFAARFPSSGNARASVLVPDFPFSGVTGSTQGRDLAFFRPAYTNQTNASSALLATKADTASVRAAGGVSPTASFTSGVAAAAANTGEADTGVTPLADIIDPRQPFILYTTEPGDTVSAIATRYGVSNATIVMNNPEVSNANLIQKGQQIIVPRKDGILYKIKSGDTVDSIVAKYDNITSDQVVGYKPNSVTDPDTLKEGDFLLLVGATIKPPPPPPPPPPARPSSGGGSGGAPAPGANGIFHYPLAAWQGVSDPFGVDPAMNRFHTGHRPGPVSVSPLQHLRGLHRHGDDR